MALEKDFELLDDYLANRLSAEDKASFEKQIDADPELKQEFNTQQKLVEGIRQARVTELKGMLNNVPISALPTSQTLFIKLGVVAVVAGLIGTGMYYFLLKDATEVKAPVEIAKKEVPAQEEKQPVEQPKEEEPDTKEIKAPVVEEKAAPKKSHKDAASSSVKKKKPEVKEEAAQTLPKPEAYDPSKDDTSDSAINHHNLLLGSAIRSMNTAGLIVNNIPDNKKYDFHYQFFNGKLTLYGQKFRDSSMYELLEFFGNKEILNTVYLYQSKKYYLLRENNEEITRLTPETNAATLSKLEEYRKRK